MKAKTPVNNPDGCMTPFCKAKSTATKRSPKSKPLGPKQSELKRHNRKFGSLKS